MPPQFRQPARRANNVSELRQQKDKILRDLRLQFPLNVVRLSDMALVDWFAVKHRVDNKFTAEFLSNNSTSSSQVKDLKDWVEEKAGFAILSHRWGHDELRFQDVQKLAKFTTEGINSFIAVQGQGVAPSSRGVIDYIHQRSVGGSSQDIGNRLEEMKRLLPHLTERPGLAKLIHFCALASSLNCPYAWLDTGCIDKTSSTVLERSIRSMFQWYRFSKLCIIHLAGTTFASDLEHDPWFTRGWTLQELLAPRVVRFYNKDWMSLLKETTEEGINQAMDSIFKRVSRTTRVSMHDLLNFEPGMENIREMLEWASGRETTEVEDLAYCLLGMLRADIAVRYGGEARAFLRLQEEIIKKTRDYTLFLWNGEASQENSFLAASPKNFASFGCDFKKYVPSEHSAYFDPAHGFTIILPLYDIQPAIGIDESGEQTFSFNLNVAGAPKTHSETANVEVVTAPAKSRGKPMMQVRKDGKISFVVRHQSGNYCQYSTLDISFGTGANTTSLSTRGSRRYAVEARRDGRWNLAVTGGMFQEAAHKPVKDVVGKWTYTTDFSDGVNEDTVFKVAILATDPSRGESLAVLLRESSQEQLGLRCFSRVAGSPVFIGTWPSIDAQKVIVQ